MKPTQPGGELKSPLFLSKSCIPYPVQTGVHYVFFSLAAEIWGKYFAGYWGFFPFARVLLLLPLTSYSIVLPILFPFPFLFMYVRFFFLLFGGGGGICEEHYCGTILSPSCSSSSFFSFS